MDKALVVKQVEGVNMNFSNHVDEVTKSYVQQFNGGTLTFYTGTRPANADAYYGMILAYGFDFKVAEKSNVTFINQENNSMTIAAEQLPLYTDYATRTDQVNWWALKGNSTYSDSVMIGDISTIHELPLCICVIQDRSAVTGQPLVVEDFEFKVLEY